MARSERNVLVVMKGSDRQRREIKQLCGGHLVFAHDQLVEVELDLVVRSQPSIADHSQRVVIRNGREHWNGKLDDGWLLHLLERQGEVLLVKDTVVLRVLEKEVKGLRLRVHYSTREIYEAVEFLIPFECGRQGHRDSDNGSRDGLELTFNVEGGNLFIAGFRLIYDHCRPF